MPVCQKCGVQLDEGAAFCKHCGTPVRSEVKMKCPKCGGEMLEGKASVRQSSYGMRGMRGGFGMGFPGMGSPGGGGGGPTEVQWQEKSGRKTGTLVKSDEERTMSLLGRRCTKCGYVEFYAKEQ